MVTHKQRCIGGAAELEQDETVACDEQHHLAMEVTMSEQSSTEGSMSWSHHFHRFLVNVEQFPACDPYVSVRQPLVKHFVLKQEMTKIKYVQSFFTSLTCSYYVHIFVKCIVFLVRLCHLPGVFGCVSNRGRPDTRSTNNSYTPQTGESKCYTTQPN